MVNSDVVVVGAGIAGLICAQRLRQMGHRVIVVEKSRGLGGRLATRRLSSGHADHGVRCLEVQGALTQGLIDRLCKCQILQPWVDRIHTFDRSGILHLDDSPQPRFTSATGITSVAKFLGTGLEIWHGQRVKGITATAQQTWDLTLEPTGAPSASRLTANALVITIPAPQALALLEPLLHQGLAPDRVAMVRSVKFSPCITSIAAYSAVQQPIATSLPWRAVTFLDDPDLDWVAIDSSKRPDAPCPTVIVQSTARFAKEHLETSDLQRVGQQLLERATVLASWLAAPEVLQVHRWRYAFATQPLPVDCVVADYPLPILCGGDWCGGGDRENGDFDQKHAKFDTRGLRIESALRSGLSAAEQLGMKFQGISLEAASQAVSLSNLKVGAMLAETIDQI
ncbi:FAD-dependent oxidoreductase [filamentous cyanobacterium CCP2]|nr:FAD-dependent oxidoreductase [filamentous cyanobacterium CCP2]